MPQNDSKNTSGAPPRNIHIEGEKKTNWLAWLLLAAGLLALLLALSRCSTRDAEPTDAGSVTAPAATVAPDPGATTAPVPATTPQGTGTLGAYLGGTEAAPRTFVFERLNFDTAKSDIRPADRAEIDEAAATLARYDNVRVRVVGYADARGAEPANAALGKARADAVKAALVAKGIAADRIETASGGENDPVDSNATPDGRAENRRTELIVTQR